MTMIFRNSRQIKNSSAFIRVHPWSLLLFAFLACISFTAMANEAAPVVDDPLLEKRVTALAEELRCLVCQNQTLADSHAELAIDLKNQVREQLRQGKSEREVTDYMVARYGDFVLYRPPVKATTWFLWFGPLLLLVVGLMVLVRKLRSRRKLVAAAPGLSAEEHTRATALLMNDEGDQR